MDPATWAWVGLAAYVLFYDTWALANKRETMSGAFGRAVAHPSRRWPVTVLWLTTTLHLYDRLPEKLDPFVRYAYLLRVLDGRKGKPCLPRRRGL